MTTTSEALLKIRPNTEWVMQDNDISTLVFVKPKDAVVPSQDEIDAAIVQIDNNKQSEAQAKATARAAILDRLGLTAEEAALLLS
jgi:hypothetical protein